MHILVVEDEKKILNFLTGALSTEGHTTSCCSNFGEAQEALESPYSSYFNAVLLDRMLGERDGADLIPLIRKKSPLSAILIVSALNSPEDKAAILDRGADDYLGKPFSLLELSARVRALGRRIEATSTTIIRLNDCILDPIKRSVHIKNQKMDLTGKEFQLLLLFIRNPGRVYSRFQLLDQIWNMQHEIESNVVEVAINGLRKKIVSANSQLRLLSKRNVGYWIEI